jgi:hypothetical protein
MGEPFSGEPVGGGKAKKESGEENIIEVHLI